MGGIITSPSHGLHELRQLIFLMSSQQAEAI